MKLNGRLSIGELSAATGVKIVTIRYYEQIKVMPAPLRTEGNYRAYNREHLHRLQFIRRCRGLGFTIDRLRELLDLSTQAGQECARVDRITEHHLQEIERKIADLQTLAGELRRIKNRCSGKGVIADCRILEALSPGTLGASK
ncbi:MAG: helix-turn-helix domain-containing protein [Bryobacteraceae bacterium]